MHVEKEGQSRISVTLRPLLTASVSSIDHTTGQPSAKHSWSSRLVYEKTLFVAIVRPRHSAGGALVIDLRVISQRVKATSFSPSQTLRATRVQDDLPLTIRSRWNAQPILDHGCLRANEVCEVSRPFVPALRSNWLPSSA